MKTLNSFLAGLMLTLALSACAVRVQPNLALNVQARGFTAADCKDGGWRTHYRADGSAFRNQGGCVSYAQAGK